jgi:hypothetical protein
VSRPLDRRICVVLPYCYRRRHNSVVRLRPTSAKATVNQFRDVQPAIKRDRPSATPPTSPVTPAGRPRTHRTPRYLSLSGDRQFSLAQLRLPSTAIAGLLPTSRFPPSDHKMPILTGDQELEQRNRLPTLMEVLGRRTLAPVDLFSFYIYMRDQQRSVDYLDFWYIVPRQLLRGMR